MPFTLPSPNASVVRNAQYFANLSDVAYEDDPAADTRFASFQFKSHSTIASPDGVNFAIAGRIDGALVIACRGSDEQVEDWWHNFNFNQNGDYDGYVHRGFYESANSLWTPLVRYLNATWERGDVVWITGHSLGGAIATLLARWLHHEKWEIAGVHTFGQPRVGDDDYAAAYPLSDVHYRFVNNKDIAPQLPLPWMGPDVTYKHVGTVYQFDKDGDLHRGGKAWSALTAEFARSMLIRGIGSTTTGLAGFSFEDHSIKHYIEKIDAYLE